MIVSLLAQGAPGPEFGKSSPVGLVIIVALLVGTALLIWSMNKQIKKLPESFEKDDPGLDQALDEGTDRGAVREDARETKPGES
ncbi:hypothetical protein [Rhodococcoides fascians]|jgi:hypothetical protein|uniref:hypothetical protein n=1 Tax=Rhodococcoides fascians TaxID=1828 RepID=UPI00056725D9|nr:MULTISPECIES: hypothetical protein [Rhodococcus]OZE97936.1 hypothetical protein CH301_16385 [Rhodococcus sp. 15-1189-1-1a]OZF12585.1 hypothetical protein CH299_17070 [Rhodococcus sp. 14-2686-1-2]